MDERNEVGEENEEKRGMMIECMQRIITLNYNNIIFLFILYVLRVMF